MTEQITQTQATSDITDNPDHPAKKRWYQSKTIWFNVVALAVTVATHFLSPSAGTAGTEAGVSGAWNSYAPYIVTVINLLLRRQSALPIR